MAVNNTFRRQTYLAKTPEDVSKGWHHVDAEGIPLGRLAAEVAIVLMGKHRPEYTPHVDTGEFVVVTNATKVHISGRKAEYRMKQRYTKHPSGLKEETYGDVREKKPELLVRDAVRRMLPKNRLSRVMLQKLHVFPGAEHAFANHKPSALKIPLPSKS
jgi:large subunit ribosomal protein L13